QEIEQAPAPGEKRRRSAGVREDQAHVRAPLRRAAPDEVQDGATRVERELGSKAGDVDRDGLAALRDRRMHEDDGATPIELREDREDLVEGVIAEHPAVVLTRQEHDAVQAERVERVLQLA